MADRLALPQVERIVRMLLSLTQPPPALLFLTVRAWCIDVRCRADGSEQLVVVKHVYVVQ